MTESYDCPLVVSDPPYPLSACLHFEGNSVLAIDNNVCDLLAKMSKNIHSLEKECLSSWGEGENSVGKSLPGVQRGATV